MSQDLRFFSLSTRLPGRVSSGAGVPGRCLCIEGKVCCGETFCPARGPLLLSLSPGGPCPYRLMSLVHTVPCRKSQPGGQRCSVISRWGRTCLETAPSFGLHPVPGSQPETWALRSLILPLGAGQGREIALCLEPLVSVLLSVCGSSLCFHCHVRVPLEGGQSSGSI